MATSQMSVDSTSAQQIGISRWWRVVGGLSMNLALGTLYAWSVFVRPAGEAVWLEARRHLHGLHYRRDGVRAQFRGGGPHPG